MLIKMKKLILLILCMSLFACGGDDNNQDIKGEISSIEFTDHEYSNPENDDSSADLIFNPYAGLDIEVTFELRGSNLSVSYPIGRDCFEEIPTLEASISAFNRDPFVAQLFLQNLYQGADETCPGNIRITFDISEIGSMVSQYFDTDSGTIMLLLPLASGSIEYQF